MVTRGGREFESFTIVLNKFNLDIEFLHSLSLKRVDRGFCSLKL